jgi:thioredoxin reductase
METAVQYLVIGAGPAGLQIAQQLAANGREYLVVEAGDAPGQFFTRFPRHRQLISINKRYTGRDDPEFNLRMDWNSLLSDDSELLFTRYSERYFPDADDMVRYLADFARRQDLRIRFNARIVRVERAGSSFGAVDATGDTYRAERVIVATGVSRPNLPAFPGADQAEHYVDVAIDPTEFIDKRVLIVGKGNSALECAENLIESAAVIHLVGPDGLQLAWQTHFVGHVRAVNNNFLDTYQLKSQNAVLDATIQRMDRDAAGYRVQLKFSRSTREHRYDRVILCTGFRFDASIFAEDCPPELTINGRFPALTPGYRSVNVPGLYFAGTITQSIDFKQSTSGFIHGFRYGARALARILEQEAHGRSWPHHSLSGTPSDLTAAIAERVSRTSGLWQQFGVLADVVDVSSPGSARYFEEIPLGYLETFLGDSISDVLVVTLEYGPDHHTTNPFGPRSPEPTGREHDHARPDCYLHPTVRHYRGGDLVSVHHVRDSLENDWDDPELHLDPLRHYLESELATTAS